MAGIACVQLPLTLLSLGGLSCIARVMEMSIVGISGIENSMSLFITDFFFVLLALVASLIISYMYQVGVL